MRSVNLTIDNQQIKAEAGQTILEAATAVGIHIPTLCHHPALEPAGSCRVCLVEISKFQPLYPACAYKVSEGLTIETRSPRAERARRFVLDMIFSERNHYCMVCERSGHCELQDLGYLYGLDHWAYPTYREPFPVDASRDMFLMDHNRCVLCRRCVRACSELVANHTLGVRRRGAETMVCADMNLPFGDSSCISCGTCVQVCPTGALIDKRSAYMDVGHEVETERVKSTCHQCSVGCGIEIVVRGGNIVRIEGDWEADPNGGTLCKKGRFEPLTDERPRITRPLVRRNGRLEVAEWDAALAVVAQRLGSTNAEQVGLLTSSQATNEALYLANWLFRQELGAKCGLLSGAAAKLPPAPGKLEQIGEGDLILVVGADLTKDQPVVSFLVKRAVDKGTRLILVNDPDNDLALFAQMQFEIGALGEAVELAARAESPLVMYGTGVTQADLAIMLRLERATFIALQPGANTRAALAYGIEASFDGNGAEVLYVLLGEEDPGDQDNLKRRAEGAFLVVQTCYESPLAAQADVVLPSAIWYEQEGTVTNLEGCVKRVHRAIEPRGEAKANWEILSLLARALGREAASSPDALAAQAIEALG